MPRFESSCAREITFFCFFLSVIEKVKKESASRRAWSF